MPGLLETVLSEEEIMRGFIRHLFLSLSLLLRVLRIKIFHTVSLTERPHFKSSDQLDCPYWSFLRFPLMKRINTKRVIFMNLITSYLIRFWLKRKRPPFFNCAACSSAVCLIYDTFGLFLLLIFPVAWFSWLIFLVAVYCHCK